MKARRQERPRAKSSGRKESSSLSLDILPADILVAPIGAIYRLLCDTSATVKVTLTVSQVASETRKKSRLVI
jgi:hypothetical protein